MECECEAKQTKRFLSSNSSTMKPEDKTQLTLSSVVNDNTIRYSPLWNGADEFDQYVQHRIFVARKNARGDFPVSQEVYLQIY